MFPARIPSNGGKGASDSAGFTVHKSCSEQGTASQFCAQNGLQSLRDRDVHEIRGQLQLLSQLANRHLTLKSAQRQEETDHG
jgi:hypothetical protein